ncbi:flagellar protein FliT [Halomonas koreensis]|uniref:Flagellar protein FliT n=1 Tax=Halomonas koreensis TaxID=245385 RepID=A0ABU1G1X5_9GAMM|nr:flagellar protein FliT [Halomonas koreensis]MDR5866915.1 flagellar protein FliT [Halomonas koreensis]
MTEAGDADEAAQDAVIAGYRALLECSERMLALAREADWAALVELEADYVQRVERLAERDAIQALSREAQVRKAELLEGILENDLEIRRHLERRRDELGELLGTSQRQRDLQRAYGGGGGRVLGAAGRFARGEP